MSDLEYRLESDPEGRWPRIVVTLASGESGTFAPPYPTQGGPVLEGSEFFPEFIVPGSHPAADLGELNVFVKRLDPQGRTRGQEYQRHVDA